MSQAALTDPAPTRAPGVFSPRVILALIFVGVFSFSAFMTLTAFEPELSNGDDGRAHALSRSAIGYAGILKLARAQGAIVHVGRTRSEAQSYAPFVVFTPERPFTADEYYARANNTMLIVLPKWRGAPNPRHPGWISERRLQAPPAVTAVTELLDPTLKVYLDEGVTRPSLIVTPGEYSGRTTHMVQAGAIEHLQTIAGAELTPIMTASDGGVVLGQLTSMGEVYILSDPDIINTMGLADIDNARVAMAILDMLRGAGDPIAFDVTLNGFERSRNLLRLAFDPPFVAATMVLAAVAGLLAWRAITLSGPKRRAARAIALGKRALAENSAALIRLAGRAHRMGVGYAQLTTAQAAELVGAVRADSAETIALLDRVGERLGLERRYSDLVAEAGAAETPAHMLAAARNLYSWREEMLRATR